MRLTRERTNCSWKAAATSGFSLTAEMTPDISSDSSCDRWRPKRTASRSERSEPVSGTSSAVIGTPRPQTMASMVSCTFEGQRR